MSIIGRLPWLLVPMTLAVGCTETIDIDPIDETPVRQAQVRPPAISGGTLAVADGLAVVADPDRDLVYVVDLAAESLLHTIALPDESEPGRVAFGSEGLAHVVLRRGGQVATIDLKAGEIVAEHRVCAEPRGLAFEADPVPTLHIACADGTLAHAPEAMDGEIVTEQFPPDLRDVVLWNDDVMASRFRAAEMVSANGTMRALEVETPRGGVFEPHVAWRARVQNGQLAILHQVEDTRPVQIERTSSSDDGGVPPGGGGSDLPYGGGGDGALGCNLGIVSAALTLVDAPGDGAVFALSGMPLLVDVAVGPDGQFAFAAPGAAQGESTLVVNAGLGTCGGELPASGGEGQVTSVDFTEDGALVAFSREPAQLVVRPRANLMTGGTIIPLSSESRFDTGHEIFHRVTESNLSCATCHPEAGDDGHVWQFTELGHRRTQPLDVGLEGTAPFHWDGDMVDLDMIMDEVLSHRMGGLRQSPEREESFRTWLFERELPPVRIAVDADLVATGEQLFTSLGCASCHYGPNLMSNDSVEMSGMTLQVPSLRRVAVRPPYMHDGRSQTLEDAVYDMLEATGKTAQATTENVAAITAYLRTQ